MAACLASALCTLALPIETKGRGLTVRFLCCKAVRARASGMHQGLHADPARGLWDASRQLTDHVCD